jgi:hypothetical protein
MMRYLLPVGCVLAAGCSGEHPAPAQQADPVPVAPRGNLLIEEVYYSGAPPAAGRDHYFSDQFIRLRNVSEAPVAAGGLLIGDAYGLAGAINRGDTPDGYVDDPEAVVLANLWRVPGDPGEVVVSPGACLLIAQDAGQHRPYSAVDLWDADFETFVDNTDDRDDAVVPNLEPLLFTGGVDWLVTVFGPTIVVLDPVPSDELVFARRRVSAPASAVVDTMEALMDAHSGAFKRLHPAIDSGFTHVSGTYTGEAVRRVRTTAGQLQDTDDSSADFERVFDPRPDCPALR